MSVKKRFMVLMLVLSILFPMVSYAGELKGADAFADVKNMAMKEYLKVNQDVEKESVKAYASKLFNSKLNQNDGAYLVEIAEEKVNGTAVEINNVSAYKIEVNSNKKSIAAASIEEILYSIEMKHRLCSTSNDKTSKEQTIDAFNEYCRATCRALSIITVDNAFKTSENIDSYVKYVNAKTAPASHAFYALTSSIESKIKADLLNSKLNAEALGLLKEKLEQLDTLLNSLNAKAISSETSISKHYDPTHPGHLHQSPNGTLYHQSGDNGPYSSGSYNSGYNSHNNHGGHYNNHNNYPSTYYPSNNYPQYPPPTYYPPQYPQYPPPTYPQSGYYPSYPGQIEHIHHCSRCRRQFSYYPNGYSIVCPYCGYVGY